MDENSDSSYMNGGDVFRLFHGVSNDDDTLNWGIAGQYRSCADAANDPRSLEGIGKMQSTRDEQLDPTNISSQKQRTTGRQHDDGEDYEVPEIYANLDELVTPSPIENPGEDSVYRHKSLEQAREEEQENERSEAAESPEQRRREKEEAHVPHFKRLVTQLYTISYLIFFAILGTLARLGLQAITFYPGAPVVFSVLWPNFVGSLIMGFLSEDRMLFKEEWGTPKYQQQIERVKMEEKNEENGSVPKYKNDLQAAKKAHAATKKTIPLYIGLATGFCGSFTSFSSFIRDAFLAMSNSLPAPHDSPLSRDGGYSFMALLAVIIISVALSLAGLYVGAHLAIALEPFTPSLSLKITRKVFDRVGVVLAWGCWLGAIFLAIFPPDRNSGGPEIWRGRAVFAIVFAPLGCLGRFYASLYLNGKIASFPLGTFVVNVAGTAILGMCYDMQHVPLGGIIGCQVLQGIEDGFCGCLTTVSTWVSELSSLRRSHSYRYGGLSVIVALCFLIVIMGSMQWTIGFETVQCLH